MSDEIFTEIFATLAALHAEHGRWPTPEEFAAHVGIEPDDALREHLSALETAFEQLTTLETALYGWLS